MSRLTTRRRLKLLAGFTLVELVLVIMVLGILAVGITSFIGFGAQIYADSTSWQQQQGDVRYASQRLTLDVQNAVPGSINVTRSEGGVEAEICLSLTTLAGSERYLAAPLASNPKALLAYPPSCCGSTNNCRGCEGKTLILIERFASNGQDQIFSAAIESARCLPTQADCQTVQLQLQQALTAVSYAVGERYFIVDEKIRWCANERGQLSRNGVLMGQGLGNDLNGCDLNQSIDRECPFVSLPPTLTQNNLVRWQWLLTAGDDQQWYQQQAQVFNVP
ncbi:type II secretion system protein [Ferrimonas senticii]|uniref:type II secretion system protein n=1 Tax=Ferrimonas senticii TaxID=394566 RepID=UPI00048A3E99|nr:prepilin-type N-terminal cleavage/methylation domain-containing protein [Ferrimonas senticii]